jgi:excinuclease UvrABC nuclease subunit
MTKRDWYWTGIERTRRAKEVTLEVYICYDADEQVIYVGRTDCFSRRWARHKSARPDLWRDTRRVVHHYYPTYGDQMVAEAIFIRDYQPRYNRDGVTR